MRRIIMANKVWRNRSELFDLISGRARESNNAKFNQVEFNDSEYTKIVVKRIQETEDLSYNEDGFTLLHLAVQEIEYDFVSALLAEGVNVNAITVHGVTPLHKALMSYSRDGMKEIVQLLLDKGANYETGFGNKSAKDFAKMIGLDIFND